MRYYITSSGIAWRNHIIYKIVKSDNKKTYHIFSIKNPKKKLLFSLEETMFFIKEFNRLFPERIYKAIIDE